MTADRRTVLSPEPPDVPLADVPLADRAGPGAPRLGVLVAARWPALDRRGFLAGLAGLVAASGARALAGPSRGAEPERGASTLCDRPSIAPSKADRVVVPEGYRADVVIGFGDALGALTDDLDTARLAAGILLEPGAAWRTARRFGFNNDFLAWIDLAGPEGRRDPRRRALLFANHEYVDPWNVFPRWPKRDREAAARYLAANAEATGVLLAAHGASLVEIARDRDGRWRAHRGSTRNRRVTGTTPIELCGPAAGHELLRTAADPRGERVLGMFNNCAGGTTPWGTVLTCEENVDKYFGNLGGLEELSTRARDAALGRALAAHRRLPPARGGSQYPLAAAEPRFDAAHAPTEPFRFGWVVEIDPLRPEVPPRKRTALGRFKHEGATCRVAADGRVAVYSGDDAQFEYLYKFVTAEPWDPARPDRAVHLLDRGTLFVARLEADGSGRWLPLVHGRGPLTSERGFESQGDVVVRAREAADRVGATPLDRPEDVEASPVDGRVYVALTNNSKRRPREGDAELRATNGRPLDRRTDATSPRGPNVHGHVLELEERDGDAAASSFRWSVLLLCGDPRRGPHLARADELAAGLERGLPTDATWYAGQADPAELAPLGSPDNLAFDASGELWIATDGNAKTTGANDGVFAVPVTGPARGRVRQVLSGPHACEICGPLWSPDGTTFLCAIQHPGDDGSVEAPTSTWPDGPDRPPRPAVVAVQEA